MKYHLIPQKKKPADLIGGLLLLLKLAGFLTAPKSFIEWAKQTEKDLDNFEKKLDSAAAELKRELDNAGAAFNKELSNFEKKLDKAAAELERELDTDDEDADDEIDKEIDRAFEKAERELDRLEKEVDKALDEIDEDSDDF